MQKLDKLDDINLFRKAFGNLDQALKTIEKPFFILDSMIVKCKSF